jgi:ribonuclease P protein component
VTRDASDSLPESRSFSSLRGRRSFARVYREGSKRRVGELVCFVAEGPPGPAQVGFVAGKRVGNAVVRNRAKRRLRAVADRVPLPHGTAWIVVALPGVDTAPFHRLVGWMEEAVRSGTVPGRATLLEQEEQR